MKIQVYQDTCIGCGMCGTSWNKRHYAGFKEDSLLPHRTFANGATSWSANGSVSGWKYCKLAEENN